MMKDLKVDMDQKTTSNYQSFGSQVMLLETTYFVLGSTTMCVLGDQPLGMWIPSKYVILE